MVLLEYSCICSQFSITLSSYSLSYQNSPLTTKLVNPKNIASVSKKLYPSKTKKKLNYMFSSSFCFKFKITQIISHFCKSNQFFLKK